MRSRDQATARAFSRRLRPSRSLSAPIHSASCQTRVNHGIYVLPAEHAAWLTRAATPDNIAATAQLIPQLAAVEDALVRCFRTGAGCAISTFHCTPVSLAQGGPGLGTKWGEELACEMLAPAGFSDVRIERLPHDPINVYHVARP